MKEIDTETGRSARSVEDGPDGIKKDQMMEEVEEGGVREGKNNTEEEKKGGFIDHLISTLPASLGGPLSPKSSRQVDEEEEEAKGEAVESITANGGDGIINNFISSFLNPRVEAGGGEAETTEAKEVKKEEGGGLINNLVSHLPVSLPDDAVPAADEVAILIHSIIHD
ncbi:hypothetical protein NE237_003181 [Protea cynaroides]|uniref:Uncharacterized protein n=1 Tax=Protea cynaroides TaxID=273540 RepID=A0A9Q0KGG6_9MAGN|nr:hypothetical protein NE237_003181 [Protea cynaroides]